MWMLIECGQALLSRRWCLTGFHLDPVDGTVDFEQALYLPSTRIVLKVSTENLQTAHWIKGTLRIPCNSPQRYRPTWRRKDDDCVGTAWTERLERRILIK